MGYSCYSCLRSEIFGPGYIFYAGGPVVVTVGFSLMSINAIDVVDMVCIKPADKLPLEIVSIEKNYLSFLHLLACKTKSDKIEIKHVMLERMTRPTQMSYF